MIYYFYLKNVYLNGIDKNSVYGEFYPSYITKSSTNKKIKQLQEVLKDTNVKLIYPLEVLLEEKKNNYLYYKADTHWNKLGALLAYEELMKEISGDIKDIEILKFEDFDISESNERKSDLEKMLKYEIKDVKYPIPKYKNDITYNTLLNDEAKKGILTYNENKELKVIMLRDSFARDLVPYISQTFKEVEYLWYRKVNLEQEHIAEEHPDIVIDQVVERMLDRIINDSPELKEVE